MVDEVVGGINYSKFEKILDYLPAILVQLHDGVSMNAIEVASEYDVRGSIFILAERGATQLGDVVDAIKKYGWDLQVHGYFYQFSVKVVDMSEPRIDYEIGKCYEWIQSMKGKTYAIPVLTPYAYYPHMCDVNDAAIHIARTYGIVTVFQCHGYPVVNSPPIFGNYGVLDTFTHKEPYYTALVDKFDSLVKKLKAVRGLLSMHFYHIEPDKVKFVKLMKLIQKAMREGVNVLPFSELVRRAKIDVKQFMPEYKKIVTHDNIAASAGVEYYNGGETTQKYGVRFAEYSPPTIYVYTTASGTLEILVSDTRDGPYYTYDTVSLNPGLNVYPASSTIPYLDLKIRLDSDGTVRAWVVGRRR